MAVDHAVNEASDDADLTIASTVRALLAYQRVPQEEIAAAIGLSQPQFSRRLNHQGFSAAEVSRIATFLGVNVQRLYDGIASNGYESLNGVSFAASVLEPGQGQMELALMPTPELSLSRVS